MTDTIQQLTPYGTPYCAECDQELRGTLSDATDNLSSCCGAELRETEYWLMGSRRDSSQQAASSI